MKVILTSLVIALAITNIVKADDKIDVLFSSDEIIDFTIQSSFDSEKRREDEEKVPAILSYKTGVKVHQHPILMSARGSGRKARCKMPPVKLTFLNDTEGMFRGLHKKIKVVNTCESRRELREPEDLELIRTQLLKEYLRYKLVYAAGVNAFKVRLGRMKYLRSDGSILHNDLFFFIEHKKDVAKRISAIKKPLTQKVLKKLFPNNSKGEPIINEDTVNEVSDRVNKVDFTTQYLVQLLIVNGDWAGIYSPDGGNIESFLTKNGGIVTLHYDFDLGGKGDEWHGFVPEPTVDSDYEWLKKLASETGLLANTEANEDSNQYTLSPEEHTALVEESIRQILPRENRVSKLIRDFKHLSPTEKAPFISRAQNFYEALKKFEEKH